MLGAVVTVAKIKRPGGTYWFEMRHLDDDEYGTWLAYLNGYRWRAPHEPGLMPFDAVVLAAELRPFVTWWVDDPTDRRIEVDVCMPPLRTEDGWSFIDLELDPVRHEGDGRTEIDDEDEFDIAVSGGWITPGEAQLAVGTARAMASLLRSRVEPWGDVGWRRLQQARSYAGKLL